MIEHLQVVERTVDMAGRTRVRVLLRNTDTGEEWCEFLKLIDASTEAAEITRLVARHNDAETAAAAERQRKADPEGDRLPINQNLRKALREGGLVPALMAQGVTHLLLADGRQIPVERA
jgi:hypothetical protein